MKLIKIISINFIVFLIGVFLLEFTIIQINKNKIKCSYVLCNYNITYKNKLYEPFGNIVYKKDKYGFRGRVKDISKIDILVFGGSTTDERYLNLNDTWTEQLEQLLKKNINNLDIVNAGIDGQSTFGHIWNFKNWISKIDNFETKYVFFYIGINDSLNSGFFDMESTNYQTFSLKNKIKFNLKNNNAFIFGVYKSFLKLRIMLKLDINPGHKKENINKNYYINDDKQNFEIDESFRLKYTQNIKELTRLTKKIGAEPVFITQRTLQWFKEEGKIYNYGGRDHYKYELFRRNIIMEHCNKNDLFCIDVFNDLDLKNSDTYDLVHLTPSGSSKVAKIIEKEILKNKDFLDKLKN